MFHIDAHDDQIAPLPADTLARIRSGIASLGDRGEAPQAFGLLRVLDIVVATGALIFFAPLMVVIAFLVWLQDGGPVLYSQRRLGHAGRSFQCLKFRTMVVDAEGALDALLKNDPDARREWSADRKLKHDPRITRLGDFLRKSSLDELPQLINVLRGEMSVVGPRPIVDAEVPKYGRWFRYYRAVRPGMTGLWQISGRNHVDYRRRVAMDVLYVRRLSVLGNVAILFRTIPAVLLRSGSY